jgi:hypothetical protein
MRSRKGVAENQHWTIGDSVGLFVSTSDVVISFGSCPGRSSLRVSLCEPLRLSWVSKVAREEAVDFAEGDLERLA